MSNTRHAPPGATPAQERYASSPEFERGLMCNLVSKRCNLLPPEDYEIIYFVQELSHTIGLVALTDLILERFPKRLKCGGRLPETLQEICLNPQIDFGGYNSIQFSELIPVLREYRRQAIEEKKNSQVVTTIGRAVFDALEYCLVSNRMVIIDGHARIGKTHAVKQWIALRPGVTRYVQVPSSSDEISFFRAIAKSLGVSINLNSKAHELRGRCEEVLQTGHLTLILDEGWSLWPRPHCDVLPRRVNWLMTALINYAVPVAVIVTPQFLKLQQAVERKSSWSSEQFIGRIGHYEELPSELPVADLEAVARHLLPDGKDDSISALVKYAQISSKGIAGIDTAVGRAKFLAMKDNRTRVTARDIAMALQQSVIPSDKALVGAMSHARNRKAPLSRSITPEPQAAPERQTSLMIQKVETE